MHQNKNTACQNKKHSGSYISKQNHKSCAYFGRLHKKNSTEFIIAKATFRYLFFFLHLQIQVSKRLDIFIIHDRVYNM